MSYLTLRGVGKGFGKTWAVSDLSLNVEKGECVSLLGPSGCGKSTTLNLIAGFLGIDQGEILIDGRCVNGLAPGQRNAAMVFQNYALFPHLNIYQNIAFGLKMRKCSSKQISERVSWALDLIRLNGYGERRIHALSGGQQQRVALARAIVVEPSVLLLDEPLSSLDAKLRETMRFEIREIQRKLGITTIFVTHDQEEALAVSDRIAVMREGHIDQFGKPADVYERPANLFVADFLGQANVLRGAVLGRQGAIFRVSVADGMTVLAEATGVESTPAKALVIVRPERVRLCDRCSGVANSFEGTVLMLSYLGARTYCRVQIGALTISALIDSKEIFTFRLSEGARVVVEWGPQDALMIDDEE